MKGDFHLGAHNFFFFSQHLGVISLDPQLVPVSEVIG